MFNFGISGWKLSEISGWRPFKGSKEKLMDDLGQMKK